MYEKTFEKRSKKAIKSDWCFKMLAVFWAFKQSFKFLLTEDTSSTY